MKTKICIVSLLVVFKLLMHSSLIQAQAPPITYAGPVNCVEGTFSFPVLVTGFQNVDNISLVLNYDNTKLAYETADLNPLIPNSITFTTPDNEQSGQFRLSHSGGPGFSLPDNSALVTLTFTVLPGVTNISTPITWSNIQGDCEYSPPAPDVFSPSVNQGNFSDYFKNGYVSINPIPTISGPISGCQGLSGNIYITEAGMSDYTWTISSGGLITSGIGSNTIAVTWTGSGAQFVGINYENSLECEAYNPIILNITESVSPEAPIVSSVIQPNCSNPTGSVVLSGLPSDDWSINPGDIDGNSSNITIIGLNPGTYNYTVTNSLGCSSIESLNVDINPQPQTPFTPIVVAINQPSCSQPSGSVELSGLPSGNWIINPGAIAGSGSSTTLSNLFSGTYNFTVTNEDSCTSPTTAAVVINSFSGTPQAPIVGIITQPTCSIATGSVDLSGLPSGNWTLNPGNITNTGSSFTINGITAGTYYYTVTNTEGCTSLTSVNVIISIQPDTPTPPVLASVEQPGCLIVSGSITLSGLPSSGMWTLNPGPIVGSGSNATISELNPGSYNYIVTNASGCSSTTSAIAIINPLPTPPATPTVGAINQPTCTIPTGSVVLSGLPSGNWTINPGAFAGIGTSTTLSGLTIGTHNFTVTDAAGCTSVASTNVVIGAQPSTPATPTIGTITQPTCALATGSVILNGLPAGNWILNPGAITGTGTSTTLSDLITGTHTYSITNATGCTSVPSANVIVDPQPASPIVSLGTDLTICGGQSILLDAGNPGCTYFWTPGDQPTQTKIIDSLGLGLGAHTISVLVTAVNTCSASDSIVITFDPCTGIAENNDGISFGIDPNPSNGMFYLTVKGLTENATLDIFDLSGQIIYSKQIDKTGLMNNVIDLTAYPKGMYFTRFKTINYSQLEKVIVD